MFATSYTGHMQASDGKGSTGAISGNSVPGQGACQPWPQEHIPCQPTSVTKHASMGRSWVCSYGLLGWQGQAHGTTCSYMLWSAAVISTHASAGWPAAHSTLAYKCRDSEAVSGRFAKVLDAPGRARQDRATHKGWERPTRLRMGRESPRR